MNERRVKGKKIDSQVLQCLPGVLSDFDRLQKLAAPFVDVLATEPGTAASVTAQLYFLPDLAVAQASHVGVSLERTRGAISRYGKDQVMVLVCHHGTAELKLDQKSSEVREGDILFLDLTRPFRFFSAESEQIALIISRNRLRHLSANFERIHGQILRAGVPRNLLASHVHCLLNEAPAISTNDAQLLGSATLRLASACLTDLVRRDSLAQASFGHVGLTTLKAAVDRQIADPELGPDLLASQFGISRATLYRIFAPLGGVSSYVLNQRLQLAHRELMDPLKPRPRISQLAYKVGFSNPAVFARAFKEQYGVSPKAVRDQAH